MRANVSPFEQSAPRGSKRPWRRAPPPGPGEVKPRARPRSSTGRSRACATTTARSQSPTTRTKRRSSFIFEEVQDGGVVTPTEWRTLSYIADGGKDGAQYALTAPARKYLLTSYARRRGAGRRRRTATGTCDEADIETDEEEDLPATVRKVRGSGGNDAAAGAGARNKRVSFGAARDDVSVGPPIASTRAKTRRHSWRRRHPLTKIAAYEWMPGSDDDDDHHAPDTDAPPTTTEKPHVLPTPAGDRTADPAARATRHRAHVAPAPDPSTRWTTR